MRAWVPGLVGFVVVVSALAPGSPARRVAAQEQGADKDDPAEVFRALCASCHVAPDPGVATDRAFIRQLQETA